MPADGEISWLKQPQREVDAWVLRCGLTVVKFHASHTDPEALQTRLSIVSDCLGQYWLPPLLPAPLISPWERLVTLWPYRQTLAPGQEEPWEQTGRLLANLHNTPAQGRTVPHTGPDRLRRALDVATTSDLFPDWLADRGQFVLQAGRPHPQPRWVHGDFHLGQLARDPSAGWTLIDPDDLGLGDPAWDLARPAALWAVGLLDDQSWTQFINAYRHVNGPAIPEQGNPWPALDLPARAAAIIMCVQEVLRDPQSSASQTLLAACRLMGSAF